MLKRVRCDLNKKKTCFNKKSKYIKSYKTIKRLLRIFNFFNKYTAPKTKFTKFVSLGINCLPRTYFTQWGIKKNKASGELSMPFDLMYGKKMNVIVNLFNDFKYFFDDLDFNKETQMFCCTDDRALYNHDQDLNGDLEKFVERYENRIKNFLQTMKSKENILFIQLNNCVEDESHYINCLFETLKFKRGKKPFALLILDLTYDKALDLSKINPKINVIREPFPSKEYVWWKPEHKMSEVGVRYEERLKNRVLEFLSDYK